MYSIMKSKPILLLLIFVLLLSACVPSAADPTPLLNPTSEALEQPAPAEATSAPTEEIVEESPPYRDASLSPEERALDLLGRMSLEEKIGQMTQVEKNSIPAWDVSRYHIGSILSGGGGYPRGDNTPAGWIKMVDDFQAAALDTPLGIPLIYGVDAVHGHSNLYGATVFPHNIGLGAADDPELVEAIGRATAEEMIATGIPWNFAPVLAVVQDLRWGRTYEAYGENTDLVTR
jgi:beta-glucosidase